ncbi:dihydrofolate reductase [Actinokineospora baliensis]|uniref:dihydrofolate reductase family protein n=1 Tax=Actinokineospora baliensis TaxID=547056 RepID=UPI0019594755|nr:dihydrofolate reductase family protein [Actinokineospora baliensis]MBM7774470.1 dihydrofolate reductase [Actinokineospora baliensis]
MKLTIVTQVSVDGVMQANGGNNEELDPGFDRGGWARQAFSEEALATIIGVYQRADAFLFGRRTYELFAGYWGTLAPGASPFSDAMNSRPKFVASNTITEPEWADTMVLSGDLATAIRDLRTHGEGELQVHGSGALARWLIENDLVDEITLFVVPAVIGAGTRLFPENGRDIGLDLVEARTFPGGTMVQVFRPNGKPRYATS